MRKIFTFFLALAASVGTMMASTKIGDLYYELYDATSTAAVTYEVYAGEYDKNYPSLTDVVVPSSVTYNNKEYTVTAIEDRAFGYANHIKTIQLPSTIETIGHHAFNRDTALTEINIPEGVTVLKEGVLSYTLALTNIKLPSTIEKLERQAFMSAMKLETITLPANVSMISQEAFYYCQSLKSVIFKGTSKPSVGTDAFKYTPAEFTFYVPCGKVPTFTGITTNIKDTMVYEINVIADHAVVNVDTTECKRISISLEAIDDNYVFLGWKHGETNASFDTVVTRDVSFVADIRKVPAVGDTIRYEYKGNNLYYKILYKNPTYKTVGLVNDGTPGTYWTESNEPEGALVIPDSIEDWQGTKYAVTDIYEYAFRDCEKITSIDLSETQNISVVGRYSFGGCTAATSVTLSDKIKYIYSYAFYRMPLTSFDLKNVEELGQWIFLAGSNIETVNIPKTLRIIPDQTGLFEHATTITCDAENPNFKVVDNVLYNKACTKLVALPTALSTAEIHIPTTVTTALYQSMGGFEGTLYINSEIVSTWPPSSGDNRNSPKGDVFVGCHLLDFYTTGRYEGLSGDFGNIKSLNDTLLYSFSVSAGEHGSVQFISHGQCNVREISAFPDEHYEFVQWSNGSTEDHLDITVVSDTAITASFRAIQYDITFVDGLTDEVIEVKQGTFGSAVEAPTAPTHTGWVFTGWDNDDYLNIPGSVTVTALYEVDTTGFEQIEQSPMGNCKFMKNGQLFIRRGDKIFNAQGARVE